MLIAWSRTVVSGKGGFSVERFILRWQIKQLIDGGRRSMKVMPVAQVRLRLFMGLMVTFSFALLIRASFVRKCDESSASCGVRVRVSAGFCSVGCTLCKRTFHLKCFAPALFCCLLVFSCPCAFILERLLNVELSSCRGAETGHANQFPLGLFCVLQELWGLCNYYLWISALWISFYMFSMRCLLLISLFGVLLKGSRGSDDRDQRCLLSHVSSLPLSGWHAEAVSLEQDYTFVYAVKSSFCAHAAPEEHEK